MTNIVALTALNASRWAKCVVTPNRMAEVNAVAKRLCDPAAKARYQAISQAVWGAPDRWYFVALTHEREASQRWDRQLGQGDLLDEISRHVPKGLGPFLAHPGDVPGNDAFHRCAVFTLQKSPPYAVRWTDWSPGGVMTLTVLYNGTGYEDYHHEASPYDWGATNIEQEGKYIEDGIYSAAVWDKQLGCAAMLKGMIALDPSITFEDAIAAAPVA